MPTAVLAIFAVVYLGMILGEIPRLAMDRTGIALLGAIALMAIGAIGPQEAWRAIDVPTIALLFGLMVASAQFRIGGFYTRIAQRLASAPVSPQALLALLIAVAGGFSAVLTNDIVCLAVAPVLIEGCSKRGLNPLPFLLALACASNVGSAATLIGNPQNILIGQVLDMNFARYLIHGGVPAILGLAATWAIIAFQFRSRWHLKIETPTVEAQAFNAWQTGKAVAVMTAMMVIFLFIPWPREVVALAGAGVLMLSRRTSSRRMLGLVDWQLLVLFIGLFIVNHALQETGSLDRVMQSMRESGVDPARPAWLFVLSVLLSNVVSNVPAVMLLRPAATHPLAGPVLTLSSTLAGNLFLVGSIANLIVVKEAQDMGIRIDWRSHAKVGVPVTVATLAIAAGWLWLLA